MISTPSPAASLAAAARATSCFESFPSGPQPSLTAVKFCSFSAVIASVTSSVVSGISIEA